jgi:hypothetical protein
MIYDALIVTPLIRGCLTDATHTASESCSDYTAGHKTDATGTEATSLLKHLDIQASCKERLLVALHGLCTSCYNRL